MLGVGRRELRRSLCICVKEFNMERAASKLCASLWAIGFARLWLVTLILHPSRRFYFHPYQRCGIVLARCSIISINEATLRRARLVLGWVTVFRRANCLGKKVKVKAFPYSIPSVGPGADPGIQAVSPQVTVSHPPGGRLPLLSVRSAVTSPPAEHHRPLAGTKLYCLVTEEHRCKQLAQGCYAALPRVGFEPATY